MKPPPLRTIIGILVVGGGIATVLGLLFAPVQAGSRDAAVPLVTLLLTQAGVVIRSLFREPPTPATEKHDAQGDKA